MYSLPSTSQMRAPSARSTKKGLAPTPRNARTGEFTPAGIRLCARENNSDEREFITRHSERNLQCSMSNAWIKREHRTSNLEYLIDHQQSTIHFPLSPTASTR